MGDAFSEGIHHYESTLSKLLEQVFKDIFPELSNSVSPPA